MTSMFAVSDRHLTYHEPTCDPNCAEGRVLGCLIDRQGDELITGPLMTWDSREID